MSKEQQLSAVVSVPADKALPPHSPYYMRPYKKGGREYRWFKCIDCNDEQETRKGKSVDLGISLRCNKCIRECRKVFDERNSHRHPLDSCPNCGMKK